MVFNYFLTYYQALHQKKASSHCTLMADSVQWFSQSDYSIYISIQVLVEFY